MPMLVNKLVYNIVPQRSPFILRPLVKIVFSTLQTKMLDPRLEKHAAFVSKIYCFVLAAPVTYMMILGRLNNICQRTTDSGLLAATGQPPPTTKCLSRWKPGVIVSLRFSVQIPRNMSNESISGESVFAVLTFTDGPLFIIVRPAYKKVSVTVPAGARRFIDGS